ncbi:hypothetical protein ABK040_016156 [Willaertia magna]
MSLYATVKGFLSTILLVTLFVTPFVLSSSSYTNPVINSNTPDPGVLYDKRINSFIAVSTSNYFQLKKSKINKIPIKTEKEEENGIFPIHISQDLATWHFVGYVFPSVQNISWGYTDFWAPEIHSISLTNSDGSTFTRYLIYFTARKKDHNNQLCIGVAYSDNHPLGPFKDIGKPLVEDIDMGNIDAHFYNDADKSGNYYLLYKTDGNGAVPKQPAKIWIHQLNKDGLSLNQNYQKKLLMQNTEKWEGDCVEGPWVIRQNNLYYLFYSANTYNTYRYAVGIAVSDTTIDGNYIKSNNKLPILFTNENDKAFLGPGHCSVVKCPRNGNYYMIYHTWVSGHVDQAVPGRVMNVDIVNFNVNSWNATVARFNQPSSSPLPVPCPLN